MTRTFLSPLLAASLVIACAANAAPTARGNLIFDGIPERPLDTAETLDAYLSAR